MKGIRKAILLTTAAAMVLSVTACASEKSAPESEALFATVHIASPEAEKALAENDADLFRNMRLRYSDDKTVIPLCLYCDGDFFATVPKENEQRAVETFCAEEPAFSDEGDEADSYAFYVMKRLATYGVIQGDTDGRANPRANVTRAEATAMVLRMLGIETDGAADSGFSDVTADMWFCGAVAKAKELGIVRGDSADTFSPQRNVSREEMTVMAARAVWCAGLQQEKADVGKEDLLREYTVTDIDTLSDWAYSAYALTGALAPHNTETGNEVDAEGIPLSYVSLRPQTAATRAETAELIMNAIDNFQVYPTKAALEFGFDREMPVIDGSTSTYPITQAVYSNLFSNGFYHPSRPEKHSKTNASYQRLIRGEVDVLIAAIEPAEAILEMEVKEGVELELIPIAHDAMVFFTNADNPAEGLTSAQIGEIYRNNAYANWNEIGGTDALLYPYCRNVDSGAHAQMERLFLNGGEIHEAIRTETMSFTMENVLTDVMNAETDDPKGYGLGYSIYYYFNNMDPFFGTKTNLKLLAVDGVAPTDETIADGSYPLASNTYVVIRKDEKEGSAARKFAEFMRTAVGRESVRGGGFEPLGQE